jgi:hypothetical protein
MTNESMNISVTILSKMISGDEPCLFKHWYSVHNKETDKHDLDKKWISWRMKHNDFVTEVSVKLQEDGGKLKREEWIKIPLSNENVLLGKVDLLQDLGDEVKIYEIKSGAYSSHTHVMQILIYLDMLRKLKEYKNKKIIGILKYDNAEQTYNLSDIPENFSELVSKNIKILLGKNKPAKIMGGSCKFCEVPCELKE